MNCFKESHDLFNHRYSYETKNIIALNAIAGQLKLRNIYIHGVTLLFIWTTENKVTQ